MDYLGVGVSMTDTRIRIVVPDEEPAGGAFRKGGIPDMGDLNLGGRI
jgi:hypothetical protein